MSTLALLLLSATALGDLPPPQTLDLLPTLTLADARINEGDSGLTHLIITVRLA